MPVEDFAFRRGFMVDTAGKGVHRLVALFVQRWPIRNTTHQDTNVYHVKMTFRVRPFAHTVVYLKMYVGGLILVLYRRQIGSLVSISFQFFHKSIKIGYV